MKINLVPRWRAKTQAFEALPKETLVHIIKIVIATAALISLIFASLQVFQSWQLYRARLSLDCVLQINQKLSDAVDQSAKVQAKDEQFFDLVTKLITLGDQADAAANAQRQQILQQLNDLESRQGGTQSPSTTAPSSPKQSPTTTVVPQRSNPTTSTTTSSPGHTTQPATSSTVASTTTTTSRPGLLTPITSILNASSIETAARSKCERSVSSALRGLRG